ncbi:helix-turn-helix transcriptional regulator [Actinoplanes sp. NBRC 103695]|uniref:helix-turn-helix domain-containing protein n=1 Tax=Actinoplanes sp. NBRC 103695 TaxID=3032202 RepID=UPI002554F1F3|nr:helix-turn-helix transcriptional regulator [Actinoplanes sp. NBRC 103695]
MPEVSVLAARLRALRESAGLTQSALGRALGVSVPLISAWEKGTVPPPRRLAAYAQHFAPGNDDGLRAELLALRSPEPVESASHPLAFAAGEAVTIVGSRLPDDRRAQLGQLDQVNPDYIDAYKYADLDALIELLPVVTSLNPASRVTIGTAEDLPPDGLTEHLILLGGVDWNPVTAELIKHLEHIPVRQLERPLDEDPGGFVVDADTDPVELVPRIVRTGARPRLVEDVAHFLRAPNPYNRRRTLTIFNGSFSRGTHGVVRALTDFNIRDRNAAHLARRFPGADTYSVVCRVRMVARQMVVPDWTVTDDRLHEWPGRMGA